MTSASVACCTLSTQVEPATRAQRVRQPRHESAPRPTVRARTKRDDPGPRDLPSAPTPSPGLIDRIPHTLRQVTDFGLVAATFLTRLHIGVFFPGLADLTDAGPSSRRLRRAFYNLHAEIDNVLQQNYPRPLTPDSIRRQLDSP